MRIIDTTAFVVTAAILLGPIAARAQAPAQPPAASQAPAEQTVPDAPKTAPDADTATEESQPTGNERYTLRLCNESSRQSVFGAVAVYDSPSDDQLTVHAWYKIEKGACTNVVTRRFGNYKSHTVFVHGYSGTYVWPGSKKADLKLCVDRSRPYQRMNSKNYTCQGRETIGGFRKIKVDRLIADDTVFTYRYQ